jgi:hypothetical protein
VSRRKPSGVVSWKDVVKVQNRQPEDLAPLVRRGQELALLRHHLKQPKRRMLTRRGDAQPLLAEGMAKLSGLPAPKAGGRPSAALAMYAL